MKSLPTFVICTNKYLRKDYKTQNWEKNILRISILQKITFSFYNNMRNRDFQSVRRFKRRRLTELYLTRRSCTAHRKCGMAPRMLNININRVLAIERVFCVLSAYRLKLTYQKVFPHREMRLRSIFASSRIMNNVSLYFIFANI